MLKYFAVPILALLLFVFFRTYRLIINYHDACKFNLPIIILPVSFEDPWWLLLRPLFSWVTHLPLGLGRWYPYTDMGWPMIDGYDTVSYLGETFILVAPTRNQIVSAYPPAVESLYRDIKTWIIPEPHSQIFTFYGQNVSSTNGAEWQRHRKITAQAFNERSMRSVWEESVERAIETTESFEVEGGAPRTLANIRSDFEMLAMRVLAAVGFGQEIDLTDIPPGHRQTLMDSLGFILKHVFISIVFAGTNVPDILLPKVLKRLKLSVSEFRLYMEESVLRNMQSISSTSKPNKGPRRTSLLEAMVSANHAEISQTSIQTQVPSSKNPYLTDSELYGNLFVFNLAGFETTASTLSFAIPYLALYPEIQAWVVKEVDAHYTYSTNQSSYEEIYPKLVRCLALMYETLRLAGSAPQMIRSPAVPTAFRVPNTDHNSYGKDSGFREITVQPDTLVSGHFYALHLSPRWGQDAKLFNPKRFVKAVSISTSEKEVHESFAMPPEVQDNGALYIAWVFGQRVCPGKKFSQVEFVAIIAHILSLYKIEVLQMENENEKEARGRLTGVLREKYFNVSAHIKRPEDAGVRFVRRTEYSQRDQSLEGSSEVI